MPAPAVSQTLSKPRQWAVRTAGAESAPRHQVAKWQLPDAWALIAAVPRTSVGKFDKKAIRKDFADGTLDIRRP